MWVMAKLLLLELIYIYLITVDVRASLYAPRLIPWVLEVNSWVKPSMALRGLKLVT